MRSSLVRLLELVVIPAHLGLVLWGSLLLLRGASLAPAPLAMGLPAWLLLGLTIPSAWLAADLCSGIVHFVADNFGSPTTPLLGKAFIAPFREHHEDPDAMLAHDFFEKNASSALLTLPLVGWVPLWPPTSLPASLAGTLSLQLALWILMTNEIHAASHCVSPSPVVRWLQTLGIILPPTQHQLHHDTATHKLNSKGARDGRKRLHYCITSGACDRLLLRLARPLAPLRTVSRVR